MHDKTRRRFLQFLGTGGAVLATTGFHPWLGRVFAETPKYRGATYLTSSYHALRYGIDGFIEYLRNNATDSLQIEFFDSGTLLKADQLVSGLRVGTIQFMFHTTTYISKDFPILGITGLPGVCEQLYKHGERLAIESPLWKLINDELAEQNLFMLTAGGGVIEPQYIWSGKEMIASLEDLKGKRCRVVGHEATEVLKSFGVTGVRIPSSQAYLALQRNSVDAVVANISTIIGRSLHEQLRYCYKLPVTAYSIGIFFRKDHWDRMPETEKEMFWKAGTWYDENDAKTINNRIYPKEFWPIIEQAKIQIIPPEKDELERFSQNSRPVWQWWKDKVGGQAGQKALNLAMGME